MSRVAILSLERVSTHVRVVLSKFNTKKEREVELNRTKFDSIQWDPETRTFHSKSKHSKILEHAAKY